MKTRLPTLICPFGLGVYQHGGLGYLYYNSQGKKGSTLCIDSGQDGFEFSPVAGTPSLGEGSNKINPLYASDFRISQFADKSYLLAFKYKPRTIAHLTTAVSKDLITWTDVKPTAIKEVGMVVPNFTYNNRYVMYLGEEKIKIAYSPDGRSWNVEKKAVLVPRDKHYDSGPMTVGSVFVTEKGIVLFYHVADMYKGAQGYALGAVIFDPANPAKVLWRAETPVLSHIDGMAQRDTSLFGISQRADILISYWNITGQGIVAVAHPRHDISARSAKKTGLRISLEKLQENPIIKPIASHFWESKATFNPAAIYENGKVHLLYRAVGDSDVSVLGYAASSDGVTFDERSTSPVYVPRESFEVSSTGNDSFLAPFFSGGAYGGAEDPRITKLDGRLYVTYVAYNGYDAPRVAITSISEEDFNAKQWNWKKPVIISKPGEVNKNAAILPEKVGGKYVIYHRVYPDILVDYVDSLDFDGNTFLQGQFSIGPRKRMWDSRKVGVGPPPFRTKYGWLMIYHAVDDRDPSRYKMGAMILDEATPHRVLFRSKYPILEPEEQYENEGLKYGVAYPCGAVTVNDDLFVYYGGADMVTCAARANLDEFLDNLRHYQHAHLTPVALRISVGT